MTAISREVMRKSVRHSPARYAAVESADRPEPQGVVTTAWRLLGCTSRRVTERELAIARKVTDRIADICLVAGAPAYLAKYFAHSDAKRKIDGSPLPLDANLICHVVRDLADESVDVTEYATGRADQKAALLRATDRALDTLTEFRAALGAVE